ARSFDELALEVVAGDVGQRALPVCRRVEDIGRRHAAPGAQVDQGREQAARSMCSAGEAVKVGRDRDAVQARAVKLEALLVGPDLAVIGLDVLRWRRRLGALTCLRGEGLVDGREIGIWPVELRIARVDLVER